MILNEELNYDQPRVKSLKDLSTESSKVIEWVGSNKKGLEIGCHTGNLSEWISRKDNKLTGVDINSKALKIAEKYLDKNVHCNIEDERFWNTIKDEKYDFITIMHVLEHLQNPWEVLKKLTTHLTKNGVIIIGLPNICNARDRFLLFKGEFNYTVDGVMDKTHLRFFNQKTAREMIKESGLKIDDYFSPWQINPIYCMLDHVPIFWRLKKLFNHKKPQKIFRNKKNLTDVVMLFKCSFSEKTKL